MLSDFDLAKQSGRPGGRPATVTQIEPNGVSPDLPEISVFNPLHPLYNPSVKYTSDLYPPFVCRISLFLKTFMVFGTQIPTSHYTR